LLEISTTVISPSPAPLSSLWRGAGGEVSLQGRGEYVDIGIIEIKISDTGIGIPPDKLPKLFKRGYTDKAKGSGYGLYIAKKHIDGLGGEIDVESEVGKGTTFTVMLPL
jgi:signal transduction histidine kinase